MSSSSTPICNVTVFIATSLDGFIARKDGTLDWLPGPEEGDDDNGYSDLMASIDVLVMGRSTFDFVCTVKPWPYNKPVVVLTRKDISSLEMPEHLKDCAVSYSQKSPQELVEEYAGGHIYVDGGRTIQSFLEEGLVTDLVLFRVPVLLGSGIPLFNEDIGEKDIHLELVEACAVNHGMVKSVYRILSADTDKS